MFIILILIVGQFIILILIMWLLSFSPSFFPTAAGGREAALFAVEMATMYQKYEKKSPFPIFSSFQRRFSMFYYFCSNYFCFLVGRYAALQGWQFKFLDISETTDGGYKVGGHITRHPSSLFSSYHISGAEFFSLSSFFLVRDNLYSVNPLFARFCHCIYYSSSFCHV